MQAPLPHSLPNPFSHQQLQDPNNLFSTPHAHPSLVQQHELDSLDTFQFDPALENQPSLHNIHAPIPYDQGPYHARNSQQSPRFQQIRANAPVSSQRPPYNQENIQYGIFPRVLPRQKASSGPVQGQLAGVLTPQPAFNPQPQSHTEAFNRLQNEIDLRPVTVADGGTTEGHFSNMKMVPNPPNLREWRQRLFQVHETISLTEDEFQTYFPHVDNIYSHRSTQKYKKKPFVCHYWDCRLKGRPPGTKKSDDPNKKKRKRQARDRDLCDVKIKVTEYFPGARAMLGGDMELSTPASNPFAPSESAQNRQPASRSSGASSANQGGVPAQPGSDGARYYTIQRVNGNGANGKGDGTAGGHKHTIEESDRVKKNSIHRHLLREEKEEKKSQKSYHKKATGAALNTVKMHSKENDLKLFGSCFCPFVQRVWISLEIKGLSYQYIEIDPYKKPDELLAVNPRGLIPALKHGDWGCYESSVLMEYLEDLSTGLPLLPQGDPKTRAHCRLWSDHINRKIFPHFYGLLQAQDPEKQTHEAEALKTEIGALVEAADPSGPFFLGPHISFVDIQFAPWVLRLKRVLTPYRDWPAPEPGSRWASWVNAVEGNEGVRATTSMDDLYVDSYERYAENRPGTSQVADAVNAGGGLP